MHLSIAALAACAAFAHAFRDTSPFLLFSSSPFPHKLANSSRAQLQSQATVLKTTKLFLNECPSEIYYIISQPSLSAQDLRGGDSVPFLKRALSNAGVEVKYSVAEVVGQEEGMAGDLAAYIKSQCGGIELEYHEAQTFDSNNFKGRAAIVRTKLASLPPVFSQREEKLAENDHYLDSFLLRKLSKYAKYTVIFTTTPLLESIREEFVYDGAQELGLHMDLKRDLRARVPPKTIATDTLPLFEKYQFLTPGIFMGLLTAVLLLAILSIGMKAVSSLQVSYGAFEKEMGPAAQKNQQ